MTKSKINGIGKYIVPTVSHNEGKDERKHCKQIIQPIHMVPIINNSQPSKGDIWEENTAKTHLYHLTHFFDSISFTL